MHNLQYTYNCLYVNSAVFVEIIIYEIYFVYINYIIKIYKII